MGAPTTTSTMPSPSPGCAGSSESEPSQRETLTPETSGSSSQPSSHASTPATSSPASGDGPTRSSSPAGPQTDLFGQALVPASRSAAPAKAKASTIPVISGRRGFGSSASAALQSSLESRLRARLASRGSTMFRLIWRAKVTPSGRRIFQRRALALRTSDSGFSSWPTPEAGGFNLRDPDWIERRQQQRARRINGNGFGLTLGMAVTLAGWPTPTREDGDSPGSRNYVNKRRSETLNSASHLAPWATPQATDASAAGSRNTATSAAHPGFSLTDQVRGDRGTGRSPSSAETGKSGSFQLNARFSLWLQGYPTEWASCGEAVTRSSRRSRQSSSARSSKRSKA